MISRLFKSRRPKAKPQLTRKEALACVPVAHPRVQETHLDNGLVQLTYPIVIRSFLTGIKMMAGRGEGSEGLQREKRIELDQLGSEVWRMINGRRSVAAMAKTFARTHTLSLNEAESAVTQFLHTLGKRGIIGMQQ